VGDVQFAKILGYLPDLIRGVGVTLQLGLISAGVGLVLGLVLALMKYSRVPVLYWPAAVYIEFFRTTPPLVQIVWLYYGLPLFTGYDLGALGAAAVALGLNIAAFYAGLSFYGLGEGGLWLNGVVLLSSIRRARQEGLAPREAIARGCEIRFRPIVVSAVVAVIGFLPAALSQGIGAEIQRPLARVVIGGLVSSTVLTLLVLPAICALRSGREAEAEPPSVAAEPGAA